MITLAKTAPSTETHMGALLRDALARHGVTVRVDRPSPVLPTEFLVAEHPGHTPVQIDSYSRHGARHYDIPRAELTAVAAVITDDKSTRFVYDGFSDDARPVEQAEACAAAVARHFGLPAREAPNAAAEERTCMHCARVIEWIEADGQGAWYDSSNQTGCADGENPHAPEPLCGWCEDTGMIILYDASTDAITGHRPCDNPPCVKRREAAATRWEEEHKRAKAEATAHVCTDALCCPPF